ncbi:MAG TPA: TolC family protein [Myxococcales bacterium]|nr:TolC family protein [Myxococcales bacterium]
MARELALAMVGVVVALGSAAAAAPSVQPLPSPLRLEQAVRIARERRAEIAAARARVDAAAERPAAVSALEDPMVTPSLDHVPFMLNGANAQLTVEQRFPLSGVLGDRRRGAEAELQRARAEADRVRLDVELDAAAAFLMLQERRQTANILEEQQALAHQMVRAATARYAAGTGSQADALRAEIEVARLDAALRATAAEVRAAEAMLDTSLGQPVDAEVPALDASVADQAPPAAGAARAAALERRPELRAGRAEIARAEADLAAMKAMTAPMGMVRTGPAYTMTDGPGWMLMVGVSVPLWGGKNRASVAEAQAMAAMADADLEAMRRMVEGDAAGARERVVAARERRGSLRDEVVPRARRAIDPTLAGYASGQLPLVSVIEAAQALWGAQGELVSAEFELGLAWARLHRAMGDPEVARP